MAVRFKPMKVKMLLVEKSSNVKFWLEVGENKDTKDSL